jgi:hypothetical protein
VARSRDKLATPLDTPDHCPDALQPARSGAPAVAADAAHRTIEADLATFDEIRFVMFSACALDCRRAAAASAP